MQVSNSLLDKDILIISKISKAPANHYLNPLYVGDVAGKRIVQFSIGNDKKFWIKSSSYYDRVMDTSKNELVRSIARANLFPIISAFELVPSNSVSYTTVDITELLSNDDELFFFGSEQKTKGGIGAFQSDKSYVVSVIPVEEGIDVKTVKTYRNKSEYATYELTTTIVPLDLEPMQVRYFDHRVGYNSISWNEFGEDSYGSKTIAVINRWRIEPKKNEISIYLKGKLVEPSKPIIFYIDSLVPDKWIPYIKRGVEAWNSAFETAGFKNAITARIIAKGSSDSNDAHGIRNMIFWYPSHGDNAYGTTIVDPRSGEIINATVRFDHNELRWLQDTYFVLASPTDSRAQNFDFSEEYMGELIESVITHEIGHTLGLDHNLKASSTVKLSDLRNKKWVEKNGFCPSIMDYCRYNYVAQVEDKLNDKQLARKIGTYDKWAIEWGYRWVPNWKDKKEEILFMDKWISDQVKKNSQLAYSVGGGNDLKEDLSDDVINASQLGIKNLKIVSRNFLKWTQNLSNEDKLRLFQKLVNQFKVYIDHVIFKIGVKALTNDCINTNLLIESTALSNYQDEAILFIDSVVFKAPLWLFEAVPGIEETQSPIFMLLDIQEDVISKLLSDRLLKALFPPSLKAEKESNEITNYLRNLTQRVFEEISQGKKIELFRRNLQIIYTNKLLDTYNYILENKSLKFTDFPRLFRTHIREFRIEIENALEHYKGDEVSKSHLSELLLNLTNVVRVVKY